MIVRIHHALFLLLESKSLALEMVYPIFFMFYVASGPLFHSEPE